MNEAACWGLTFVRPPMPSRFLSCDWGTSHFRLRLVDTASLTLLAEVKTDEGAANLSRQAAGEERAELFAKTLERHIETVFEQTQSTASACVVSGMASSNIGWMDLPYAVAPMPLEAKYFVKHGVKVRAGGAAIRTALVSGVRTEDDVMRGEECELYGLLELHPGLGSSRACVLLPGTHSKHIHLEGRRLKGFLTYMTGELFAHLRGLPTLKAPLSAEGGVIEQEFRKGVRAAQEFGLPAGLFKIRTRALVAPQPDQHAPSFLSGLLIGAELLGLQAEEGTAVHLAGSAGLHALYMLAGEEIGLKLLSIEPDILQQALLQAHRNLLP